MFRGVEVTLVLGEEAGEVCRSELMEGLGQAEVLDSEDQGQLLKDHVDTNAVGGLEGDWKESRRFLE